MASFTNLRGHTEQPIDTDPLLYRAGGKPSTWFSPGGLVEQIKSKHNRIRVKKRRHTLAMSMIEFHSEIFLKN